MDIDLRILGDRIAALSPSEAAELHRYLEETDGRNPAGVLVPVGPRPAPLAGGRTDDELTEHATHEWLEENP